MGGPLGRQPGRPPLRDAVLAFVHAGSWGGKQRVVATHTELLGEPADAELARLVGVQADDSAREAVEMHRALLHRCRLVGVGLAFGELRVDAILAGGAEVPAALRDQLARALGAEDLAAADGDMAAVDASVAAWQTLIRRPAFVAASPLLRAASFDAYGRALHQRYGARGEAADLALAISAYQQALGASRQIALTGRSTSITSGMPCATASRERGRRPTRTRRSTPTNRRWTPPPLTLPTGRPSSKTSGTI